MGAVSRSAARRHDAGRALGLAAALIAASILGALLLLQGLWAVITS